MTSTAKRAAAEEASVRKEAIEFMGGMRGQFILSQALYIAVQELEKVPLPNREASNISDMKYLLDNLFTIYKHVAAVKAACAPREDK